MQGSPEPVSWTVHATAMDGAWELAFKATIEHGWSLYSQNNYGDMGPWPTSIVVDSLPGVTVVGKAKETGEKVIEGFDEIFGMKVKKFKGSATFTQRIKADDPAGFVTGSFDYMTCNDVTCLPPSTVFYRVSLATNKVELSGFPFKEGEVPSDMPLAEEEPVIWSLATEKVKDGLHRFRFTADIQEHWERRPPGHQCPG